MPPSIPKNCIQQPKFRRKISDDPFVVTNRKTVKLHSFRICVYSYIVTNHYCKTKAPFLHLTIEQFPFLLPFCKFRPPLEVPPGATHPLGTPLHLGLTSNYVYLFIDRVPSAMLYLDVYV